MEKTPMEIAYSEYVMESYTIESFAKSKGLSREQAADLIAVGRSLHISATKEYKKARPSLTVFPPS
jgi:hypothetical protein